jgi:hypothetical protein
MPAALAPAVASFVLCALCALCFVLCDPHIHARVSLHEAGGDGGGAAPSGGGAALAAPLAGAGGIGGGGVVCPGCSRHVCPSCGQVRWGRALLLLPWSLGV